MTKDDGENGGERKQPIGDGKHHQPEQTGMLLSMKLRGTRGEFSHL